jgi:hypothetical protein
VQYDWTQNYTVTSAEVYWFNDGGGVLTPTTAYIEYWNGSAWTQLGNVPLQTNAFNTLAIPSVSLNRMRISMLNPTQSTGILEWRVMGYSSASARQAVAITDEEKSGSIITYPNPASSDFTVELNGFEAHENVELQLLDLQGSVINSKQMGTSRTTTYSKSALNVKGSSVYILKATGTKRIISGKIMLTDR